MTESHDSAVRMPLARTFGTLRFRLMAWNAAVVLLTASATMLMLREGVRHALLHEVDQVLVEDMREVQLMFRRPAVDEQSLRATLNQKAAGHAQHAWFIDFLDAQGETLWSSEQRPATIPLRPAPASDDWIPHTDGGLRIVDYHLPRPQGQIAVVRIGTSLGPMAKDLARVDRQVLLAGAGVLLFAPLGAYWLAGRATQPLSAMIQTAAHLRPSRMEDRLELRGTGDELDQLAGTINGLLDRIAVHLQWKHDLLANAAHELRTPLAAIRSSIEVALHESRRTEDYEELLGEIIEVSGHLETLVNQILLLSEAEADEAPELTSVVALDQAVARSVEMFRGAAEAHGIRLVSDIQPCQVRGNTGHFRQVVNNLLDNAIKFTPQGGTITVALRRASRPGFIEFVVSDTGVGICQAEQERVFERFFRGSIPPPRDDGRHGSGLGLSICQAVIRAHGGQILVHSRPHAGTRVTVELPEAPAAA